MTDIATAARRPGEQALSALGLGAPALDPADASPHTFPGGGRWRTEIPSCEGPEALAVVLKESSRLDVPIHRISQGSGVWMLTDAEITEMVEATAERDIELCLFTGPRGTWDIGGSVRSDSRGGGLSGARGRRGRRMRRRRGAGNGVGRQVPARRGRGRAVDAAPGAGGGDHPHRHDAQGLGADRSGQPGGVRGLRAPRRGLLNVPSDLTLDHLTEIRRVSAAPMDMYIEAPDDLGGYVRMYEVAELIRRGAPLYLKFGLSKAPGIYPWGTHLRDVTLDTARERVRRGRLALDLLARHGANTDMAPLGTRLPGSLNRFPQRAPLTDPWGLQAARGRSHSSPRPQGTRAGVFRGAGNCATSPHRTRTEPPNRHHPKPTPHSLPLSTTRRMRPVQCTSAEVAPSPDSRRSHPRPDPVRLRPERLRRQQGEVEQREGRHDRHRDADEVLRALDLRRQQHGQGPQGQGATRPSWSTARTTRTPRSRRSRT